MIFKTRQAVAFHVHLGIEEIAVFDVDPRATDKLVRNLAIFAGLKMTPIATLVKITPLPAASAA